jgi:hypothetical protein
MAGELRGDRRAPGEKTERPFQLTGAGLTRIYP